MKSNQTDETDLAFPGEVVAPALRTETGLARLPIGRHFVATSLFGRDLPLVIDLGCGNGRSTIGQALIHPEIGYVGIDVLPLAIRYAIKRANQRGLTNIKFVVGDATEVVNRLLAPGSISEIHLYHPQPYYDLASAHKRLIKPEFLAEIHAALVPTGKLILQTDNPHYWNYIVQVVPYFFHLIERVDPWSDYPEGRTHREILARQLGLPIFRGEAVPIPHVNLNKAIQEANAKVKPSFNADRCLQSLDEKERI